MSSIPLRGNLHQDKVLSELAVKYTNDRITHDKIAPMVPVQKQSDSYRTYTRNFVIPETSRAIGGEAREQNFEAGFATYSLEKHALVSYLPDASRENFDGGDLAADLVQDNLEKLNMRMEFQMAALFTTTSFSVGGSLAAADLWLTTTAAPLANLETGTSSALSNSGFKPNVLVVPRPTYTVLKHHASVTDRVKYTSRELDSAILGALVEVEDVVVPDMFYDSGIYGASAATGAIGAMWKSDFAALIHRPSNPGPMKPSTLYKFQRNKPAVRRWRDEAREAEAIECDFEFQFKVVASLSCYYLNNTI